MLVVSILAFFIVTFLAIAIVVAVSWMTFLKSKVEETQAALGETESVLISPGEPVESQLFRDEKLSTIAVLDNLLTRFDVMALVKQRIEQAGLDWPVRLLVTQVNTGAVWTVYTDFAWIAARHGIVNRTDQLKMASMVIASITSSVKA